MVLRGSSSFSEVDMVSRCVVKMEISLIYYTFGKVNEDLTPAQSNKHVPSHNIYIYVCVMYIRRQRHGILVNHTSIILSHIYSCNHKYLAYIFSMVYFVHADFFSKH